MIGDRAFSLPVSLRQAGCGGSVGAAGSAIKKNGFALTWGGTNDSSATYVKGAVEEINTQCSTEGELRLAVSNLSVYAQS